MAVGYVNKPEDVVQVGETIEARIIEVSRRRGRIDLSLKGLRPEPEAEQPVEAEQQVIEEEEEIEDPFANMEVLSPMELAFQKAMGGETEEVEGMTRKRSKRARRDQMRAIQDEIVSRTLDASGSRLVRPTKQATQSAGGFNPPALFCDERTLSKVYYCSGVIDFTWIEMGNPYGTIRTLIDITNVSREWKSQAKLRLSPEAHIVWAKPSR